MYQERKECEYVNNLRALLCLCYVDDLRVSGRSVLCLLPGRIKVVRWKERVRTKPFDAVDWDQIKFSFLLKFVFPSENNLIIQK